MSRVSRPAERSFPQTAHRTMRHFFGPFAINRRYLRHSRQRDWAVSMIGFTFLQRAQASTGRASISAHFGQRPLSGETWCLGCRHLAHLAVASFRKHCSQVREMHVPGVIPLLRAFPDHQVVRRLFRRLCELAAIIAKSKPGDDKRAEADLANQIENLLRGMAPEVTIENILRELDGSVEAVEVKVIGEIFHGIGGSELPLREALPTGLREQFRGYLKGAMATVLTQDDPYGQVKAYFATVYAQVGDASDLPEMEMLIASDLERVRAKRAARLDAITRPRRSPNP